jgi:hypothetical protein
MDIKKLAIESGLVSGNDLEATYSDWEKELNLFAEKLIAAYHAEWIAEPIGYVCKSENYTESLISDNAKLWGVYTIPLYAQPKEMK